MDQFRVDDEKQVAELVRRRQLNIGRRRNRRVFEHMVRAVLVQKIER